MVVDMAFPLSQLSLKKPPEIKFNINFDWLASASRVLGVDISAFSVKLVELSRKGRAQQQLYRLERYVIEPMPVDALLDGSINEIEQVSNSLQRALKRMGTRQKKAVMALPLTSVITKKLMYLQGCVKKIWRFRLKQKRVNTCRLLWMKSILIFR